MPPEQNHRTAGRYVPRAPLYSWLKWGFLGLALASVTVAVTLVWRAKIDQLPLSFSSAMREKPRAHVDKPFIVEHESGRTVWRLKARKAEQQTNGNLHLLQPQLELFSASGKRIPVTGSEAWFAPLSKKIRFTGDVKMEYGEWQLFCDSMRYDHQKDMVYIPGPFRIKGKATRIRGKNLTAWRAANHVRVDGGIWIEDARSTSTKVMP